MYRWLWRPVASTGVVCFFDSMPMVDRTSKTSEPFGDNSVVDTECMADGESRISSFLTLI
ncbi:hypothetical protein DVJ77_00545 [Dyella tabacisoli]|uniref:Uncharacterized protein n=1 Tax=Dyella tabacisoli TaxID=2282381 RepID=A0A369UTU2_9GAMM|nr:hypothetical protein DVJ77_00545 [Dyella tabacisoli]